MQISVQTSEIALTDVAELGASFKSDVWRYCHHFPIKLSKRLISGTLPAGHRIGYGGTEELH